VTVPAGGLGAPVPVTVAVSVTVWPTPVGFGDAVSNVELEAVVMVSLAEPVLP
jgi:hypothetical protein